MENLGNFSLVPCAGIFLVGGQFYASISTTAADGGYLGSANSLQSGLPILAEQQGPERNINVTRRSKLPRRKSGPRNPKGRSQTKRRNKDSLVTDITTSDADPGQREEGQCNADGRGHRDTLAAVVADTILDSGAEDELDRRANKRPIASTDCDQVQTGDPNEDWQNWLRVIDDLQIGIEEESRSKESKE